MIRLLKWLGIVALVVTLAINMIYGDVFSTRRYIAIFFSTVLVGWLTSFIYARKAFFQVIYLVELNVFFIYELVKARTIVAHELIKPSNTIQPGIIAVPRDTNPDQEITIF